MNRFRARAGGLLALSQAQGDGHSQEIVGYSLRVIQGEHVIIYSKDAEADLPQAEIAVHPSETDVHELYFMCYDVRAFIAEMKKKKVKCRAAGSLGCTNRSTRRP
jgi:hypothetical protein